MNATEKNHASKIDIFIFFAISIFIVITLNIRQGWSNVWAGQLYPPITQILIFSIAILILAKLLSRKNTITITWFDTLVSFFCIYQSVITVVRISNLHHANDVYMPLVWLTLYFIIRQYTKTKDEEIKIILLISSVGTVLGAYGYWQFLNGQIISGTFTNSGLFGCYIACSIPMFYFLNKTYPKYKVPIACITVLIIGMVIISKSRASCLGLIIVFIVFAIFRRKPKIVYQKIMTWIAAICFCGIIMYSLYLVRPSSADGRLLIWKVSVLMLDKNPLFGKGNGFVYANYNLYQSQYFASGLSTGAERNLAGQSYSTFNEYLRITIETGIIGLISFMTIIGCVIHICFKMKNHLVSSSSAAIGIILIFGVFSYPFNTPAISGSFYIFLALIGKYSPNVKRIQLNGLNFSIIFALAFVTFSASKNLLAILKWRKVQRNLIYNESQGLVAYKSLYNELENNAYFIYNYGSILTDLGYYKNALSVFETRKNYNVNLQSQIGRCYQSLGKYQLAEDYYQSAIYMAPNTFNPLRQLFDLYHETNQIEKAKELAVKIVNTPIKVYTARAVQVSNDAWLYLYNN